MQRKRWLESPETDDLLWRPGAHRKTYS